MCLPCGKAVEYLQDSHEKFEYISHWGGPCSSPPSFCFFSPHTGPERFLGTFIYALYSFSFLLQSFLRERRTWSFGEKGENISDCRGLWPVAIKRASVQRFTVDSGTRSMQGL